MKRPDTIDQRVHYNLSHFLINENGFPMEWTTLSETENYKFEIAGKYNGVETDSNTVSKSRNDDINNVDRTEPTAEIYHLMNILQWLWRAIRVNQYPMHACLLLLKCKC